MIAITTVRCDGPLTSLPRRSRTRFPGSGRRASVRSPAAQSAWSSPYTRGGVLGRPVAVGRGARVRGLDPALRGFARAALPSGSPGAPAGARSPPTSSRRWPCPRTGRIRAAHLADRTDVQQRGAGMVAWDRDGPGPAHRRLGHLDSPAIRASALDDARASGGTAPGDRLGSRRSSPRCSSPTHGAARRGPLEEPVAKHGAPAGGRDRAGVAGKPITLTVDLATQTSTSALALLGPAACRRRKSGCIGPAARLHGLRTSTRFLSTYELASTFINSADGQLIWP